MAEDNTNNVEAAFTKFLEKFSKPEDGALKLYGENYDLREKNRTQGERIKELEKQLPPEGATVLSKADAERFEAFKALNKKPDELKTIITEHGEFPEKIAASDERVARLERKDKLRDVARIAKVKLSVLEKLDADTPGIQFDIKDGKDGETVRVSHEGKESSFDEFAQNTWADYVPSLKVDGGEKPVSVGHGRDQPPAGQTSVLDRVRKAEEDRQKKTQVPQAGSLKDRWLRRAS